MICFMLSHSNCTHTPVDCNIFSSTQPEPDQPIHDIISPLPTSYSDQWLQWFNLQLNNSMLVHQNFIKTCFFSELFHLELFQLNPYWWFSHTCSPGYSRRSTDPSMTSSAPSPQLRWMLHHHPPTRCWLVIIRKTENQKWTLKSENYKIWKLKRKLKRKLRWMPHHHHPPTCCWLVIIRKLKWKENSNENLKEKKTQMKTQTIWKLTAETNIN